ncbi:MAG: amidohydrolase family protein [Cyanobacteria bacterium TGS_CYA1]|nr:amidohydrolase family protein [Cyanobacteria bacterium TGS_CYA1]
MKSKSDTRYLLFAPELVFLPYPERFKEGIEILVDTNTGLIAKIFSSSKRNSELDASGIDYKDIATITGGALLPGLTDAHMHPLFYSMLGALEPISLIGLNKDQVIETFKKAANKAETNSAMLFLDLDSSSVSGVDASLLDSIFAERNVCVYDASFHSGIVTSSVLKRMRTMTKDRSIPGYLKDDGSFAEAYGFEVLSILIGENQDMLKKTIEKSLWHSFSIGTTTLHDLLALDIDSFKTILEVRKNWREIYNFDFPITRFYLRHKVASELIEVWKDWQEQGLVEQIDWWRTLGLKLFADGSFGSRTAHLSNNYSDCPTCGLIFDTDEDIEDAIFFAEDTLESHSIALHAIGDRGIERILTMIRNRAEEPYQSIREIIFRIEHFELPAQEMIALAKKHNVHVVPQPNFLLDLKYKDRLDNRVDRICPLSDISDAEVPMLFGTDGMPESMLYAIYIATHARESSQRLALEQALHYSSESAAKFEGDRKGTIEVGQKADLILADASLIDDLKPGEPDIPLESNQVQSKVEQLHSKIQIVFKTGVKVFERKA